MRKRSPGLFMFWFAMNNDAVIFPGNLFTPVPYFFYKRTGSIILLSRNANAVQFIFYRKGSSECRNDHYIFCGQFIKWDQLLAVSILQKSNAMRLEVSIYLRVVNHFT